MTTITICRNQLLASICTASKKDLRFYLMGVQVLATETDTRLVSTDGNILSVQRLITRNVLDTGPVELIIPIETCEKIKSHKGDLPVELTLKDGQWCLVDYGTMHFFTPIDRKFPDFKRVIPVKCSGEVGQFQIALLSRFEKAAKILGAKCKSIPVVSISHNGRDAALVSIGRDHEYLGVIMPVKVPAPELTAHTWYL
jgi:DNA polymerase-3 subunit beta